MCFLDSLCPDMPLAAVGMCDDEFEMISNPLGRSHLGVHVAHEEKPTHVANTVCWLHGGAHELRLVLPDKPTPDKRQSAPLWLLGETQGGGRVVDGVLGQEHNLGHDALT